LHLHHFLPSLLQQQDRQFWTNIFSLILVTSALASISPAYVATTTTTGNSEVFSTSMEWTTIFSLRFEKSCLLQRHQFLPRPTLLQQQHRKVWSRKQTMEWTNIMSLRFENLWLLQRHQFLPARLSLLQQQQQQEEILKLWAHTMDCERTNIFSLCFEDSSILHRHPFLLPLLQQQTTTTTAEKFSSSYLTMKWTKNILSSLARALKNSRSSPTSLSPASVVTTTGRFSVTTQTHT